MTVSRAIEMTATCGSLTVYEARLNGHSCGTQKIEHCYFLNKILLLVIQLILVKSCNITGRQSVKLEEI